MTKQWTEAQAWRYLASCWRKAKFHEVVGAAFAKVGSARWQSIGLCQSVDHLRYQEKITNEVHDDMKAQIYKHVEESRWAPWGWPLTLQGARWRTQFCESQAKSAAAREKRRKKA